PVHRAVDSVCWAVRVGDGPPRCFLKVLHRDQIPYVDLAAAYDAATRAAQQGCTPRPRHFLPEQRGIVFDLLDASWRTARMDDLQNSDILEKVIAAKQTIQGMAPFARTWSVFDGIRQMSADLEKTGIAFAEDAWWLLDNLDDIEQALLGAGSDRKPCHADGVSSNVMIADSGSVQLVDFDRACNADPYNDLGILLNEAFQFEADMCPALEIFEGTCRETSLNRCRLYGIADDLMWAIWGTLMDAVSPRASVEFLKYAQWRLLRCRMAVHDPGFEAMLRRL
ncbi:MAG: phosphotransferase, partial [Pseudomonadota bacterium]|nr:phosphotransferase [Pseudomonadota bacterium]